MNSLDPPINSAEPSLPRSPHGEIGFLLWKATNGLMRAIDAALRPHGLTHAQCVVMLGIAHLTRDGQPVRIGAVAALDSLDMNHVSQILTRLEKHGHVIRTADPKDARVRRIALTPAGQHLLAAALPAMDAAQEAYLKALSAEERRKLRLTLRSLQEST